MRDARRANRTDAGPTARPLGTRILGAARVAAALHADRLAQDRARPRRDRAGDEGVTIEERLMLLEASP
jgi:hypothetical protein